MHTVSTAIPSCPARSVGLVRYPTTLAPASGSVTVTTQCADNAHGFSLSVRCTSTGSWTGTTPQCECDTGYRVNGGQLCEGKQRALAMFSSTCTLFQQLFQAAQLEVLV